MKLFFGKVADRVDKLDKESLRRQYRALLDEAGFYESVFKALDEGVLVVGTLGELLYANPAAEKMTGVSLDVARGQRVAKTLPDWDWPHLLAPAAEEGWHRNAACEVERTYPERRIFSVTALPSERGTVVLLRDVTDSRARDAQALESGRADAISDLAAQVAHEIGNPLNALSLNLQLMQRAFRDEPDPERRARLEADVGTARNEVKRLEDLVHGFLRAFRPVRAVLAPGSLADPLKDALATMRPQLEDRGIRVSLDLPGTLPPVALDRAQMEQVFFNLVKNAMEAMKQGGFLEIELASDDACVTAGFRDSGGGIAESTLAGVFDHYRTTKQTGSGLGLMISRRIVAAHGGEMDVESKEGAGTKFTVRLPRLEKRIRRLT